MPARSQSDDSVAWICTRCWRPVYTAQIADSEARAGSRLEELDGRFGCAGCVDGSVESSGAAA